MGLEFNQAGIGFEQQVMVPVVYKGTSIQMGFRADTVIENAVILDIRAVAALLPVHDAQLLTSE